MFLNSLLLKLLHEALEAASMQLDWYKEDANKKQFIAFTKWLVV